MKGSDLLRLVWTNLYRMRFRAVLSAMGVLIGTAAMVILVSLAAGLQRSVTQDLTSIGPLNEITVMPGAFFQAFGGGNTGTERSENRLTPAFLRELARRPGIAAVTPRETLAAQATIRFNRLVGSGSVVGVDTRAIRSLGWEVENGTLQLGRGQVLVGARVGDSFIDPRRRAVASTVEEVDLQGQTLTLELTRFTIEGEAADRNIRLRVAGVLAERGGAIDYSIFIALSDLEELNLWATGRRVNREREGYSQATIVVERADHVLGLEQELLNQGFFAFSARMALQQINTIFLVIQAVMGGIGGIALIVAGLGIANTLTMAIYERTREIGLMKAVGATNRDVMTVFLAEAGAIGAAGGIGGIAVGIFVSQVINVIVRAYITAQTTAPGGTGATAGGGSIDVVAIPLWLPIFALLFATGMGVLSGIYPAQRAASLDPVAALRHE